MCQTRSPLGTVEEFNVDAIRRHHTTIEVSILRTLITISSSCSGRSGSTRRHPARACHLVKYVAVTWSSQSAGVTLVFATNARATGTLLPRFCDKHLWGLLSRVSFGRTTAMHTTLLCQLYASISYASPFAIPWPISVWHAN